MNTTGTNPVADMEKREVRRSYNIDVNMRLVDLIEELEDIKTQVEEQGVDPRTIDVEIYTGCDYCDGDHECYAYYRRLETDAEYVKRIEQQMKYEERKREMQRKQYEELKKKFS